jgi:hypothetical protein
MRTRIRERMCGVLENKKDYNIMDIYLFVWIIFCKQHYYM